MGSYDEFLVLMSLPIPDLAGETFQSKDLECNFMTYVIQPSGLVTDLAGVPVYLHGHVNFYTYTDTGLFNFDAKFTDGRCVSISQILPDDDS